MSLRIDPVVCIGCGFCEAVCPTYAIAPGVAGSHRNIYLIDEDLCNDCGACPDTCPVDCIALGEGSIVCHGHGCPLHPGGRRAGWECTVLVPERRCGQCGGVRWREPGGDWACPQCDLGLTVGCPKFRRTERRLAEAGPAVVKRSNEPEE